MEMNHNATINFFFSEGECERCHPDIHNQVLQAQVFDTRAGRSALHWEAMFGFVLEICLSFLIRKTPGEHQEVKYLFAEKRPGLPDVLSQRAGESLSKAARITSCRVHKWLPTLADRDSFLKRHTFPFTTTPWDSAWHKARLCSLRDQLR